MKSYTIEEIIVISNYTRLVSKTHIENTNMILSSRLSNVRKGFERHFSRPKVKFPTSSYTCIYLSYTALCTFKLIKKGGRKLNFFSRLKVLILELYL